MIREKNNSDNILKWLILIGEIAVLDLALFTQMYIYKGADFLQLPHAKRLTLLMSIVYFLCDISGTTKIHLRFVKGEELMKSSLWSLGIFTLVSVTVLWALRWPLLTWDYAIPFYAFIWIFFFGSRYILRQIIKKYRTNGRNTRSVVFVGNINIASGLYQSLIQNVSLGYRVLGYFADEPKTNVTQEGYLGKPEKIIDYLMENGNNIDMLFCMLPSSDNELINRIIQECDQGIIRYMHIPDSFNYQKHAMSFELIEGIPVFSLHNEPLSLLGNRIMKRVFDIVFSTLFLITIFPWVFLIFGTLIKLSSPGPIFFKQKRNGLSGQPFWCLKFRSMKVNDKSNTLQATKDDPRKTKIGEFMRKTSIDEFPQFINVFLGQMSVVGPRPHMLKHTEQYSELIGNYMVRHFAKPGITGYAQVTGFRGETQELWQMEERVKKDIWYIEHWNMALDIYIIIKTITNGIRGDKAAY